MRGGGKSSQFVRKCASTALRSSREQIFVFLNSLSEQCLILAELLNKSAPKEVSLGLVYVCGSGFRLNAFMQ